MSMEDFSNNFSSLRFSLNVNSKMSYCHYLLLHYHLFVSFIFNFFIQYLNFFTFAMKFEISKRPFAVQRQETLCTKMLNDLFSLTLKFIKTLLTQNKSLCVLLPLYHTSSYKAMFF